MMEESSGIKKRKMGNEEEEKVDKFFALIRSTREMRDRLRNVPNNGSKEEEEKKKVAAAAASAVWNPTFQPEDFMEDSNNYKSENVPVKQLGMNDVAGPSSSKREEEKETKEAGGVDQDSAGLDLKLSL